jgi:hypothetical protein
MANEEMEKLLERVYKDIDVFDFNGKNVPISLDFSYGEIHEEFLVYANESLEFFESLANTTMLALSPPDYSEVNQDKIFMVQLPKPDKAIEAIDIIKNGLRKKSN